MKTSFCRAHPLTRADTVIILSSFFLKITNFINLQHLVLSSTRLLHVLDMWSECMPRQICPCYRNWNFGVSLNFLVFFLFNFHDIFHGSYQEGQYLNNRFGEGQQAAPTPTTCMDVGQKVSNPFFASFMFVYPFYFSHLTVL